MRTESIVPLAEEDIADAAQVLADALHDDPLQQYVLPDPEERARRAPAHFAALLRYGCLFGEVFTTEGRPRGVAIWQPPGAEVTPEKAVRSGLDRLSHFLGDEALLRLGRSLDYLERVHRRGLPLEQWYLMAVGVSPGCQRQGLGRALLQPILARTAGTGAACILDTAQPLVLDFYRRLGFRVFQESRDPDSGLRFWTLCRRPASPGGGEGADETEG